MANISGFVYYDPTRTATAGTGLQNVPVALFNTTTNTGVVALTDAGGAYKFTNVPPGNYKIIETWGTAGIASPVSFATAVAMALPPEVEPPLSIVTVPVSPLASYLNAVTPNLLNVVVASADLTGKNFYDAAVGDKPLTFTGVNFVGPNLITAADNGTWGANAGGTPVMTIPATDPYPGVSPGFVYVNSATPTDGKFTVMNTRSVTAYPWWPVSDHTTRIETGRMLTVNGANPGAAAFTQTVPVLPNTQYGLGAWVLNLINQMSGNEPPRLSLKVTGSDGTVIYYEKVNAINATEIPVWYQNGFLFNSGAFNNIKIEILSEGAAAVGNDYLIDDVRLFEVIIQNLLTLKKTATPAVIHPGSDVTFTVAVTNNSPTETLTNVTFKDILDPTLSFVTGSVTVNGSGVGYATANPNSGFSIGAMPPNTTKIVQFHATSLTGASPVKNIASGTYPVSVSANGDIISNTVPSNPVFLRRPLFNFEQASADLVTSVALQQTALSHILNAEGEKIQAMLAVPNVTAAQLLAVNTSVQETIDAVSSLECVLKQKIKKVQHQVVGYKTI
ncbi:MAG: hypothetical protein RR416_05010 [Clostridia bacterium]